MKQSRPGQGFPCYLGSDKSGPPRPETEPVPPFARMISMRRVPFARHALWCVLVVALIPMSIGWGDGAWTTLFFATFTDVPDGPGDGLTFSTDVGILETVTENGAPFPAVAPLSGIYDERLILTDKEGKNKVGFGVYARCRYEALRATGLAFDVTLLKPSTSFVAEVTDTSGVDISISIRRGQITVNGEPQTTSTRVAVPYNVQILMYPSDSGPDIFVVTVREIETGVVVGEWSGQIPGGMDPVTGLLLMKSGESPGALWLDKIIIAHGEE